MSTSVLGKRSRRSEEEVATVALPPRKRVTRASTPQIFEDTTDSSSQKLQNGKCRAAVRSSRKRTPTLKAQHADVEFSDAPAILADEQNENIPPAGVAVSTPSTNRFKNVLDSTPNTPKHRVRVLGGLLTPRTPRTIDATKPREQSVYAQARQLFTQSAAPAKLVGRESERQQLRNFITNTTSTLTGGCTYVSGPPGTGKSALVREVLQEFEDVESIRTSVINCVTLRTATQVYSKMLEDLTSSNNNLSKTTAETQLRKLFTTKSCKTAYVVTLDEIDSLVDVECEILYNIFEWSMHPSSSLILVGIANALDLTDRFLPRLKAKGLKPQLLPFLPYTAQQISTIISDKLRTLLPKATIATPDFVPCMHPAAIQLCGKKIASQTGDLRKAFNLVRRAIEQVEKEALAKQIQHSPSKQPLGELTNSSMQVFSSPSRAEVQLSLTAETAPRATIAHVAKLASSIFNNGTMSRLSGLNLQQKAVLCSIVNKESRRQDRNLFITPTKTANKAPTVGELFMKYSALCRRDDGLLQPLKNSEFRDVVASLETLGLVHESKARSSSLLTPSSSSRSGRNNDDRHVASAVAEKEMRESLNGPGADLLQRLLDEM